MDRKEVLQEKSNLEKKIKQLELVKDKLSKEKESLEQTNKFLKGEISKRNEKIISYQKNINRAENKKKGIESTSTFTKSGMSSVEEAIVKYFFDIQYKFNLNLNEKLKWDITELLAMQLPLKITYVIIKKIDFKDSFLERYNLLPPGQGEPNLSDIFVKMSKINLLGVYHLRECGPILLFRLLQDTRLEEIKQSCCKHWNISPHSYNLYDDSFNNLESCKSVSLSLFFQNYEPADKTLKEGEVTFYIMEKLKVQRNILDSQVQSIDSKNESKDEDNSANDNNKEEGKLQKCIELFKSYKILKGLENYKLIPYDPIKIYNNAALMIDNNIVMVILCCVILLLGIISTYTKKDVYYWGAGILQSKIFFTQNAGSESFNLLTMGDYLRYFDNYIVNAVKNQASLPHVIFGPMRLRFFKTNAVDCTSDYFGDTGNATVDPITSKTPPTPQYIIVNALKIVCQSYDHSNSYVNQTDILTFKYTNKTGIANSLKTGVGFYDTTGIIADIYQNGTNFNSTQDSILKIIANQSTYLNNYVRGLEFTYNTYDPNIDLFMANYILVERDILNKPFISFFDSVGFKTNVYQTKDEQMAETLDYIRLGMTIFILISLFFRVFQKAKEKNKGCEGCTYSLVHTIFQIKSLLVVASVGFLIFAIVVFKLESVDANTFYHNQVYFDFYAFSRNQRLARGLDILSLYCMTIYSLKFLQLIDSISTVMVAFKKAFFEYFLLTLIIVVIFVAMSVVMSFVYGPYIFEYNNYGDAILTNLKVFIFSESTFVTSRFQQYFKNFSIIILILFIFFIKYFLLMLYYPIYIEYYRMECDKIHFSLANMGDDFEEEKKRYEAFGVMDRFKVFFCTCAQYFAKKKKKKKDGADIEMQKL